MPQAPSSALHPRFLQHSSALRPHFWQHSSWLSSPFAFLAAQLSSLAAFLAARLTAQLSSRISCSTAQLSGLISCSTAHGSALRPHLLQHGRLARAAGGSVSPPAQPRARVGDTSAAPVRVAAALGLRRCTHPTPNTLGASGERSRTGSGGLLSHHQPGSPLPSPGAVLSIAPECKSCSGVMLGAAETT